MTFGTFEKQNFFFKYDRMPECEREMDYQFLLHIGD